MCEYQLLHQCRCLLLATLAGSLATRGACRASDHPSPRNYVSDVPVVEPGKWNAYGWTHSLKSGTKGHNGTEVVHITAHRGRLFAGIGFWMYPSMQGARIVRLDSPNGDWVYDSLVYGVYAGRPEILKVVEFTTDRHGGALSSRVELLVAGFYLNFAGEGRCGIVVRDDRQPDQSPKWDHMWYHIESPFKSNYFSARALESYTDKVTGVDYVFISTGMPGIMRGYYDSGRKPPLKFDSRPESGSLPMRPLSLVTMGGRLYTTAGSLVKRRNDGTSPSWPTVFNMADHSSETLDEAVGGLRGITAIPHPSGQGESLLFAWCPNGRAKGCMVRIDPAGNGFSYTQEGCIKDMARQIFGNNYKMPYALANYNFALPVQSSQGLAHIVGFQVLLFGYSVDEHPTDPGQWQIAGSGKMLAYYAGAGFLVRRGPSNYEMRVPGGPRQCISQINPPLVALRAHAKSPWDDSIYVGGYDGNFFDGHDTAWVLRGTAAAVHAQNVPQLGSPACTTTSTRTTSTVTTTTISSTFTITTTPACELCKLFSRQPHWLEMEVCNTAGSLMPTSRRKVLDSDSTTWGGARIYLMDLHFLYRVSKIRVDWRSCDCNLDGALSIEGSLDKVTWTTLARPKIYVWGWHLVGEYDVDFSGRYIAFRASEKVSDFYMSMWEVDLWGYADFEQQAFMPDTFGDDSGSYTCQQAQDYFSSDAFTGRCWDMQLHFKERCCAPLPTVTTTTSTATATHTTVSSTATSTTATTATLTGTSVTATTTSSTISTHTTTSTLTGTTTTRTTTSTTSTTPSTTSSTTNTTTATTTTTTTASTTATSSATTTTTTATTTTTSVTLSTTTATATHTTTTETTTTPTATSHTSTNTTTTATTTTSLTSTYTATTATTTTTATTSHTSTNTTTATTSTATTRATSLTSTTSTGTQTHMPHTITTTTATSYTSTNTSIATLTITTRTSTHRTHTAHSTTATSTTSFTITTLTLVETAAPTSPTTTTSLRGTPGHDLDTWALMPTEARIAAMTTSTTPSRSTTEPAPRPTVLKSAATPQTDSTAITSTTTGTTLPTTLPAQLTRAVPNATAESPGVLESWMVLSVSRPDEFVESHSAKQALRTSIAAAAGVTRSLVTITSLALSSLWSPEGADLVVTEFVVADARAVDAWRTFNLTGLNAIMSAELGDFSARVVRVASWSAHEHAPAGVVPWISGISVSLLVVCVGSCCAFLCHGRSNYKTANIDMLGECGRSPKSRAYITALPTE